MKYKKLLVFTAALTFFGFAANADEFKITFDWGNLKKCTSGKPNIVSNPIFKLENVPNGTEWIYFKMVDKNVPKYNHGGGWVEYNGQPQINPGEFKYKSPCPPDGKHKYEWTATAKKKKSNFGGTIGKAKSSQMYP